MTYDQNGDLVTELARDRHVPLGGVEVRFGNKEPMEWRPTGEAASIDRLRLLFQSMRRNNALSDALGQPR